MTRSTLFITIFLISSLVVSAQKKTTASGKWIDPFREFRDAVYQHDKTKAKTFFEFPLKDGLELWYLIYADSDAFDSVDGAPPLTEKDFDSHFDKIFPKSFIACLLKIKTKQLLTEGEDESPEIKTHFGTCKLYVRHLKKDKIVELHFTTSYPIDDANDKGETSYIYYFTILGDGRLQFRNFLIAG
ncbi:MULTISPECIES: hypothetical protein [unclassified Flavobacterium]|uniref:hypothetical protein n=1 Tax=unclassified Flavobacterium TaxID=196869 RepID=UPI001F131F77|nr:MULTISPECIES: hypothetical protein [unclassified Flavobacterium]UMY64544.1 hypothetical protein MKO97_08470 [Flavobacterium sp. HJ-32-4]